MGETVADVDLANVGDRALAYAGHLPEANVRRGWTPGVLRQSPPRPSRSRLRDGMIGGDPGTDNHV